MGTTMSQDIKIILDTHFINVFGVPTWDEWSQRHETTDDQKSCDDRIFSVNEINQIRRTTIASKQAGLVRKP